MWVTCSSRSSRTRPRVIVVLPAAESPTTPSTMGRGNAISSSGIGEHGAAEDVTRLDRRQLLPRRLASAVEQTGRLAQPRAVDRVAHAAGVGEARASFAALEVRDQRVLG